MRICSSKSPAARLLSTIALVSAGTACGWIEPSAPDGEVVTPLEAGAGDDAGPDPADAAAPEDPPDATNGDAAAQPDAEAQPDADAPPDGAQSDAEQSEAGEPDGGEADADAGLMAPPDAGCDEDASCTDSATPGCSADDQCAANDYCSQITHACTPRCDAHNGCLGPKLAATNNRILSDGRHVCYAADGASADQYTIYAWDGVAPQPTALGGGAAAQVLSVADGYCYYFAASSLQRARLTGGSPETLQALTSAPRRAWLDATSLWWTVVSGDQLQLFRLARQQGATPEQVHSGPAADSWEASNGAHLFRRFAPSYAKCAIAKAPISDPTSVTVIPMSLSKNCTGAFWADDSRVVFTQFEPVRHYLFRVDLANPAQENTVSLYSVEPLMYQVRGDVVYGQRVVDGSNVPGVPNTVSYWRAPLAGGDGELLFTPTPGTAAFYVEPYDFQNNVHRTYAVMDDLSLLYQHKTEHRLIVRALPAEP
ncbi:MAG TPA: hypothetical protein VFZ61_29985 [Polyangiales bacterium]